MNLDLRRQGKDEVSLDFYDRKNRRRSQPRVNYCEIDENDPELKKNSKLTQSMLSFETYWKLISLEKKRVEKTDEKINEKIPADLPPAVPSENPLVTSTVAKPVYRYMNLDALESSIEAKEKKRRILKRIERNKDKIAAEGNIDELNNNTSETSETKTVENKTEENKTEEEIKSPKKRIRSSHNSPKPKRKKARQEKHVNQENQKKAPISNSKKSLNPLSPSNTSKDIPIPESQKVIIPQNLKQQSLLSYFKKLN